MAAGRMTPEEVLPSSLPGPHLVERRPMTSWPVDLPGPQSPEGIKEAQNHPAGLWEMLADFLERM